MVYPPTLPPDTRTDSTVAAGNHASDHNQIVDAIASLIEILGADPAGPYADLSARLLELVTPESIADPDSPAGEALKKAVGHYITPEKYGAAGDGIVDDTAAVQAAAAELSALTRSGLTGTIKQPGATLILTGTYNLSSLAGPVVFTGNVVGDRAAFRIPDAYAGIAVLVGHPDDGKYVQNLVVTVPDVLKSVNASIVAGSIGVRLHNIGNSEITLGRTAFFETGLHLTGRNQGTAYNTINIGWISYCKVSVSLKPHTSSGWANSNTFIGGGIQQSLEIAGGSPRASGWRHVVLDGSAGQYVNANTFIGVSFEGDASEFWLEAKAAGNNLFLACRYETGSTGTAATSTLNSDTLTSNGHGLSVNDLVTFSATALPGGMPSGTGVPYYVVAVPDPNTFKVARKKGGTAEVFTTVATNLKFFRPPRVKFDQTGIILADNIIERSFTPQGVMEIVNVNTGGSNNGFIRPGHYLADGFQPDDIPQYRGRNRSAAAGLMRVVYAAYAASVNPVEDPLGFGAGLAEYGVMWASGGVELGRLTNASGILQYKRPSDTVSYEIASCRRAPGLVQITGQSLAATTTTPITVTLTGASVNDHVVVTPGTALPAGVAIAYARVSSTDTIQVGFLNITGSPISLTVQLNLMAVRRFF